MPQPIVKVGIIGAGNVVTANHLPVLKAMGNVDVAWIADANRKRAEQVADAYGIPFCDVNKGIGSLPPSDATLLAIPYGARTNYYAALADRGGALYIEKPLARTVALHQQLCGMFSDYNLACGLNRRAWGVVRLCRDAVKDELFGKIQRARFTLSMLGGITAGSSYLSDAKLAGGGALFEGGVHGIDTVLYCLDAQSATVASGHLVMDGEHDVHCDGVVILTDPNGAEIPFDIEVSILKSGTNGIFLEFERAALSFSLYGPPVVHLRSRNGNTAYVLTDERDYFPSAWNQVLGSFWQTFIDGFQERSANYTSASQSLLTTRIIEDLYRL